MTTRAVPFHCPFCGDTDLFPFDAEGVRGAWECRSCLRAFSLTMLGLVRPTGLVSAGGASGAEGDL